MAKMLAILKRHFSYKAKRIWRYVRRQYYV